MYIIFWFAFHYPTLRNKFCRALYYMPFLYDYDKLITITVCILIAKLTTVIFIAKADNPLCYFFRQIKEIMLTPLTTAYDD